MAGTKTEQKIVRMMRKNKKIAGELLEYLEVRPNGGGMMDVLSPARVYMDTVTARIKRLKELINDKG